MQSVHLTTQINKLTSVFGESCLRGYKLQKFAEIMSELPDRGVEKVVNDILDTQKQFPTLREINAAVWAWKRDNQKHDLREPEPTPIACERCYDCGYAFLKVTEKAETTICCCSCEAGKEKLSHEQTLGESRIPQLEPSFFAMGMKLQRFPVERFKPESPDAESRQVVVDRWIKFLIRARRYWVEQVAKDLA